MSDPITAIVLCAATGLTVFDLGLVIGWKVAHKDMESRKRTNRKDTND